jgi:hypothetical protein
MFEFIISTNKHIDGTWYGCSFSTIRSINGDVFKYTSQTRYAELDSLLETVKEIVTEAKCAGVNIIDIQIMETC